MSNMSDVDWFEALYMCDQISEKKKIFQKLEKIWSSLITLVADFSSMLNITCTLKIFVEHSPCSVVSVPGEEILTHVSVKCRCTKASWHKMNNNTDSVSFSSNTRFLLPSSLTVSTRSQESGVLQERLHKPGVAFLWFLRAHSGSKEQGRKRIWQAYNDLCVVEQRTSEVEPSRSGVGTGHFGMGHTICQWHCCTGRCAYQLQCICPEVPAIIITNQEVRK